MSFKPQAGRPLILGVDPGLNGALAWYNFKTKKLVSVVDAPILNSVPKDIDDLKMWELVGMNAEQTAFAVIEQVGAAPNDAKGAIFTFGERFRAIKTITTIHQIPQFFVRPSVWKPLVGLSGDKSESRVMASAKFPGFADSFKRAKDDGRAEAALLAAFGERML